MAGSGFSNFSSPETRMSRKRRKKASSLARNGIADRLSEPRAPGGDQIRIGREFLAELGRGLVERPAGIEPVVPGPEVDVLDESEARLIVGKLPGEKGFGVPAVKDVADVEDDGGRSIGQISPVAP